MVFCSNCGSAIKENAQFCYNCGKQIVSHRNKICKKCGQILEHGDKFCDKCGLPVDSNSNANESSDSIFTPVQKSNPSFIQARCTNCAASLRVDSSKNSAFCPYCGTPYIISNHTSAVTDDINGNKPSDFVIVDGDLKSYIGDSNEVIIPYNVITIGDGAFLGKKVTSVIIPNTVKYIGNEAFRDCLLLNEIRIPSSVEYIEPDAFKGNKNMRIKWPLSWQYKQTWKIQIIAFSENKESRIFVERVGHVPFSLLFYCGRDPSGNYFFCEHNHFFKRYDENFTISEEFGVYDMVNRGMQEMYNDLVSLFERADIDRNRIRTAEMSYSGWIIPEKCQGFDKNKKILIPMIELDDTGDE